MAWLTFFRVSTGERSVARGGGVAGVSPTQGTFSAAVSCPNSPWGMSRMAAAMPIRRKRRIINLTLLWRILYPPATLTERNPLPISLFDTQTVLHFLERYPLGFRVVLQDQKEMDHHHRRKKYERICARRTRHDWEYQRDDSVR